MHMNVSSFLLNAHEQLVISLKCTFLLIKLNAHERLVIFIQMHMNVSSFLLNAHERLVISI